MAAAGPFIAHVFPSSSIPSSSIPAAFPRSASLLAASTLDEAIELRSHCLALLVTFFCRALL